MLRRRTWYLIAVLFAANAALAATTALDASPAPVSDYEMCGGVIGPDGSFIPACLTNVYSGCDDDEDCN